MKAPKSAVGLAAAVSLRREGGRPLRLAVEFGKKDRTIGFDLSEEKVDAYRKKNDPAGRDHKEFKAATRLAVTTNPRALREADFVIVAVPTPVDDAHNPDFGPLVGASTSVG
jgi:UDP-N-acetyl-D-galactosamine dehydrogenase